MCVILIANKRPIDDDEIVAADAANSDGIGVAWFRPDGMVKWRKGLTVREAIRLSGYLPVPYVMHFRWATVGEKSAALTHPFPVEPNPVLTESGYCDRVLFHNGHAPGWKAVAIAAGVTLPDDPSDSSAMAQVIAGMTEKRGGKLLREMGGKWAIMGRGKIRTIGAYEDLRGVVASNTHFQGSWRNGYTSWRPGTVC